MFNKITFNSADTSTWPQFIINGGYNSSVDKPNLTTHAKYGAGLTWVGVDGRDISIYGGYAGPIYQNDLREDVTGSFVTAEDKTKFWAEDQMSNFTFVNSKGNTSTVTLNWGEALADGETLPAEENNDEEEPKEEPKPIEGGGDDPAELEDGEKPNEGPIRGGKPDNAPTTGRGMETFVKNLNEKLSAAYQKANELESLINKQRDILKKSNSFSDDFKARKENIQVISEDIESKRKAEVEELTEKLDTEYSKGVVINERMSEKVLDIDTRKLELDSAGAGFAEDSEYKYLKERADRMMLEIDSIKSTRVLDVKVEKKSILEETKVEKQVIARNPIQTKEEVLAKQKGGTISNWTQVDVVENVGLKGPDGQPAFFVGGWKIVHIEQQQINDLLGEKYQMAKQVQEGQAATMMTYFLYSGDMNNIHAETGKGKTTTIGVEWSATEGILSTSDLAEARMTMEFREVLVDLGKIKFTEKLALGVVPPDEVTDIGQGGSWSGVIDGIKATPAGATFEGGADNNTGKILGEE
jgi:hypothetical protein